MSDEIILRKISALGVAQPLNPTAQTIKVVLSAYFTRKLLDESTFRGYMGLANPSLFCLLEGLKAFSLDQTGISQRVQDTVRMAMEVMRARMERPDITPGEAHEIRVAILDLVRQAREESSEQRILTLGFAAFAATAFVAAIGGVMAAVADRRVSSSVKLPLLKDR